MPWIAAIYIPTMPDLIHFVLIIGSEAELQNTGEPECIQRV